MNVIRTMTLRQMRAERTRTRLTFLEITIASGLLTAVLLGGLSLAASAQSGNTPSVSLQALARQHRQSAFAQLVAGSAALVAVLLLLSASFLIRSSFAVSLSQRVRALRQLAGAGATRRQLRASVYWEALMLGAAAIPTGMALAALGLWITFSILNRFEGIAQMIGPLRLFASLPGLLFCALWSAVMLLLAAHGPARAAFRVQPVETFSPARYTKRKKRARVWRTGKAPEPQLARRSLAQDSMRHWTLCAGTAISLALIITAAGFSGSLRDSYAQSVQPFDCRWYVWGKGGTYPKAFLDQSERLFPDIPHLRTEIAELHAYDAASDQTISERLFVLEDADFEAWYGALLPQEKQTVPYVLSQSDCVFPDSTEWDSILPLLPPVYGTASQCQVGDNEIPLPLHAGERPPSLAFVVYIAAVTNRSAFEYAFQETSFPAAFDRSFAIYYGTRDGGALGQALYELQSTLAPHLDYVWQDYTPTSESAQRHAGITLLVNVFSWGFTVLVFLAASVSVIGTVSADLAMHRREYALLRSAGLTPRQMDRMLRSQCFSYCAGLPFGVVLGAWACRLFSNGMGLSHSTFRLSSALLGAALLAGVCLLALHSARKSIVRVSVVEALHGET